MSQSDAIMEHLITGAEIDPMQALHKFGCNRLAARIYDLRREGVDISERIQRQGKKYWAVYKLAVPHG